MGYTIEDIDKIVEFTSWTEKQKIDELLRIDCAVYTCLGSDSIKRDREEARRGSIKIYNIIKKIDKRLGKILLEAMDS
tara:strand:+ start:2274 stop:2507 length:234 start_codon:yes stop_codon:yes gene_type:complete